MSEGSGRHNRTSMCERASGFMFNAMLKPGSKMSRLSSLSILYGTIGSAILLHAITGSSFSTSKFSSVSRFHTALKQQGRDDAEKRPLCLDLAVTCKRTNEPFIRSEFNLIWVAHHVRSRFGSEAGMVYYDGVEWIPLVDIDALAPFERSDFAVPIRLPIHFETYGWDVLDDPFLNGGRKFEIPVDAFSEWDYIRGLPRKIEELDKNQLNCHKEYLQKKEAIGNLVDYVDSGGLRSCNIDHMYILHDPTEVLRVIERKARELLVESQEDAREYTLKLDVGLTGVKTNERFIKSKFDVEFVKQKVTARFGASGDDEVVFFDGNEWMPLVDINDLAAFQASDAAVPIRLKHHLETYGWDVLDDPFLCGGRKFRVVAEELNYVRGLPSKLEDMDKAQFNFYTRYMVAKLSEPWKLDNLRGKVNDSGIMVPLKLYDFADPTELVRVLARRSKGLPESDDDNMTNIMRYVKLKAQERVTGDYDENVDYATTPLKTDQKES